MRRHKKSLRNRIYLWVFPLLLVTVVLTVHQVIFARSVNDAIRSVADDEFQAINCMKRVMKQLESIQLRASAGVEYEDRLPPLREDLQLLKTFVNDEENLPPMYEGGIKRLDQLMVALDTISLKKSQTNSDVARLEFLIESRLNDLSIMSLQLSEQMSDAFQKLRKMTVQSIAVMGVGSVIAFLLTFIISTRLSFKIARPIDSLFEVTEAVAEGNLDVNPNVDSNDEVGRLAKGFAHMIERLRYYREINDERLLRTTAALRSIMDRTPDAVFVIKEDLTVTFKNPQAEQMVASKEFLKGFPRPLLSKIEEGFSHSSSYIRRQLDEAVHFRISGEERYFLIHTFPFDVVDLDSVEASIEDEITIAVMLQDVTAMQLSDRLKTDLVATVSHELKTPITSARMALYLLLEEQIGALNEEQRTLASTARDDLERQLSTIDHLLSFTKFESKSTEASFELVEIQGLVKECIGSYVPLAKVARIEVALNQDAQADMEKVRTDPNGLTVVLNNLVGNAIKYSPEGSRVEVGFRKEGTNVTLMVRDNGPGIKDTRVATLFDPYTRGENTEQITGTGLGLSIAKNIVEGLGGSIWCESEVNKGSSFYVSIPV